MRHLDWQVASHMTGEDLLKKLKFEIRENVGEI